MKNDANCKYSAFTSNKDEKIFDFSQLIDLAGIDYSAYGHEEWETKKVTTSGFSRGRNINKKNPNKNRFAVVYHLLSLNKISF